LSFRAIDDIAADCGRTEESHGFREDWDLADKLEWLALATADGSIDELPNRNANVETLNLAAKALRNNYVGMKLMLMVSELAEALDTLRDHGVDGVVNGSGNFGEELADTHIRLWALEDLLGVHSGRQVAAKMERNESRPHKHGRQL
jgi:hypothetical protein